MLVLIYTFRLYAFGTFNTTLFVVCCVDDRASELTDCISAIKKSVQSANIVGVIRESDRECRNILIDTNCDIIQVPHYDIPNKINLTWLAVKRSKALEYAKLNGYDVLIFVDSDITFTRCAYLLMMFGINVLRSDIVCIPYAVRWAAGHVVLGYDKPPRIEKVFGKTVRWLPFHTCAVGGMGCTALSLCSKRIPDKVTTGRIMGLRGEDIGFFMDSRKTKSRVLAASWYSVNHRIDGKLPNDYLEGSHTKKVYI